MGLIKDCIEIKRREREEQHIEEIRRTALAEADRRVEIVLKTVSLISLSSTKTYSYSISTSSTGVFLPK